jgi:hypothetical protein
VRHLSARGTDIEMPGTRHRLFKVIYENMQWQYRNNSSRFWSCMQTPRKVAPKTRPWSAPARATSILTLVLLSKDFLRDWVDAVLDEKWSQLTIMK